MGVSGHRAVYPRLVRELERPLSILGRIGDMALFYVRAAAGVPYALRY
ncbi:ABC transporter permease, partial [Mycobacterium sp. ITM-2017-0098]